jgi:polar amino acid transport system substrate-binding protein
MRRSATVATTTLLLALIVAACTSTGASTAPSAAAPSAAPSEAAASVAPSAPPSVAASPTPDACAAANLTTKTAGKLTVGADNPAYPPYFQPPASGTKATDPWELGDPNNGQGLEAATAYAIAEKLGFAKDAVTWVAVPFNNATQPGAKDFDMYLTQVSYSPERATVVDLSDGYFDLNQAVVGLAKNDISKVTTVAGLKDFELGAPVGTTSLTYITDTIQPTKDAAVYDTLDAAVQAVSNGQIDGVVVDLPTAFYVRDAQLTGGQIVGSLPQVGDVEHFSVLLDKGSALTACVNQALATMKDDGTLKAITDAWITGQGAPALTP